MHQGEHSVECGISGNLVKRLDNAVLSNLNQIENFTKLINLSGWNNTQIYLLVCKACEGASMNLLPFNATGVEIEDGT